MTLSPSTRNRDAFTLVEMVGVLAVIAILASMLTPKIFSAINDARLSAAVGSVEAVKAATVNYFGKNGNLPITNNFDTMLVTAECLERPFDCKVGNGDNVQGVAGPAGPANAGYKLDGSSVGTASAATVVECLLSNVSIADAQDMSKRMDGDSLSSATTTTNDLKGRVEYSFSSGSGTVYIYIGHR